MKKKTRRTQRQITAKPDNHKALAAAKNQALCAAFQERYARGGTIQECAKEMGVATRTAYRWAGDVKLQLAEHIRRICSDAMLAGRWEAMFKVSRGKTRVRVLEMITKIRDGFPAPKEPPPAVGPVHVTFVSNLNVYKELHAAHQVGFRPSLSEQPQRNAGSRTPASSSAGGRVLDAAKSEGTAKE